MLPWRVRQAFRPLQLSLAMRAMNPHKPSPAIIRWLVAGWGNEGWSGDTAYLEHMWSEALHARSILECGSGISTLILGAVAARTGATVSSLEHTKQWQEKVDIAIARYRLPHRVSYAPLTSYGDYDWYTLPANLPANFDLVVCDGPPSATRGGRYGLLPVCAERIRSAKILLDDAERADEQQIISRWQREFAVEPTILAGAQGACAVLRVKHEAQPSSSTAA